MIVEGWAAPVHEVPSFQVCGKIKTVKLELLNWKRYFFLIKDEINVVHDQMMVLYRQPPDNKVWSLGSTLHAKLAFLLDQEEAHWRQRFI